MDWYRFLALVGITLAFFVVLFICQVWVWWATDGGKTWSNGDNNWNEYKVAGTYALLLLGIFILVSLK